MNSAFMGIQVVLVRICFPTLNHTGKASALHVSLYVPVTQTVHKNPCHTYYISVWTVINAYFGEFQLQICVWSCNHKYHTYDYLLFCVPFYSLCSYDRLKFVWHISHWQGCSLLWATALCFRRVYLATRFINYFAFHYFFFHTDITMSCKCCKPLTVHSTCYFFFQFFPPPSSTSFDLICTLLLVCNMVFKQTVWWQYFTTIPWYILTTAVFFEMLCFHFDPAISQHTVLITHNTIPHFLQHSFSMWEVLVTFMTPSPLENFLILHNEFILKFPTISNLFFLLHLEGRKIWSDAIHYGYYELNNTKYTQHIYLHLSPQGIDGAVFLGK